MKMGCRLLIPLLAFCLSGLPGRSARFPDQGREPLLSPRQLQENLAAKRFSGRRIDLIFSRAGLQEVVAYLEKAGGVPLKLDPSVNDPVTYRMQDVPWDEALAAVLSDNGLHIMLDLEGKGFKIGRGEMVVLAFPKQGQAKFVLFLYDNLAAIAAGIILLVGLPIVLRAVHNRRRLRNQNGKRALLPPEAAERIKTGLIRALKEDHLYRDEELTLQSLAETLAVTPHQLSWLINDGFHVSFSMLVNGYRVEEVKSRLADPAFNESSILQTALEAGFNSKAAFNRAFKLQTGMTPSQYRKEFSR